MTESFPIASLFLFEWLFRFLSMVCARLLAVWVPSEISTLSSVWVQLSIGIPVGIVAGDGGGGMAPRRIKVSPRVRILY